MCIAACDGSTLASSTARRGPWFVEWLEIELFGKKLPNVIGGGMIGSPVKFAGEQLDKEVCDVMLHHSGA